MMDWETALAKTILLLLHVNDCVVASVVLLLSVAVFAFVVVVGLEWRHR